MKLNTDQVAAIKEQTNADPVPEDNPAIDALRDAFGDHTFYVDTRGLHVFESVDLPDHEGEPATVIQVASWSDEEMTTLEPMEPQATGMVIDLSGNGTGGGDGPGTAA